MVKRASVPIAILFAFLAPFALAQQTVGSNAYVDMYFGDWHSATPHTTYGHLVERDILTKGNPFQPTRKGGVLRYVAEFSYATLAPGVSMAATRLDGRQEVFYFLSGQGAVEAGGKKTDVSANIAILMPANLSFSLRNSGDKPLTMYLIAEETEPGFTPIPNMLVRDENTIPISSSDGHWTRIVKPLFVKSDGLSTLSQVSTVVLGALTMGKPFIGKTQDDEEVWAAVSGTSITMIGPFLRRQRPGMAYLHPPDNLAPTTNINYSEDSQVKFLYFVSYGAHGQQVR
jgi:mannose-6-phosphate isomerase-like protein (cupin superfamily)